MKRKQPSTASKGVNNNSNDNNSVDTTTVLNDGTQISPQTSPSPPFTLPPPCTNPLVTPLLTDMYQLSMGLAYFRANTHLKSSTFELFFRKPPFGGEFCVFAGLDQVMSHLANFGFTESQLQYIRELLPEADDGERGGRRK